ncbi:cupin domain-containing protein [Candidatus Pelagibacter bacterium]|jgi:quercetin dioxygenase-like cupin family protein|nr:cupin domain-containing protein [Candidatus Pelagibacter bacterium]MDA9232611.1 cupin domain-containing protein [Candidatus Pelagibacter sp.]
MTERIARFNELTPSTLPFVEGRIEGHKERKNYSIVGPGVAEDSQQSVKISKPHGYNLGAVSANPKNGSGLHSHTTAEVFLIYSGNWRFYWGADGRNEIILSKGDIISMPTNMFRGFENAGDEEGLIFVVLGNDDPGIITWVPNVLIKAKETGLALLDDNSLVDLKESKIPPNRKLLEPITNEMLQKFDNYEINEIEKFICRFKNQINHEIDLKNGIKLIQIIGSNFSDNKYDHLINHNTGFNLSILKAKKGLIEDLIFDKPTILFSQKGTWKVKIEKDEFNINSKDTFSLPLNTKVSISIDNNEECFLNCVSKT